MKILLTTSDFFPMIGGLTTFTQGLLTILNSMKYQVDLFHWKSISDIKSYSSAKLNEYDFIINVHVMFSWYAPSHQEKMINFIHGSEILFTSPNMIKRIFKKIFKKILLKRMERVRNNVFISNYTREKLKKNGFNVRYSRDFVFHNCIQINSIERNTARNSPSNCQIIKLVCVARDVPHKNINGAVKLAENIQDYSQKKVILYLPVDKKIASKVEIVSISKLDNVARDQVYSDAHFNLLLSLDHSDRGFFEGFGLTVLEAGQYGTTSIVFNTGGLPESVHDEFTGIVISDVSVT